MVVEEVEVVEGIDREQLREIFLFLLDMALLSLCKDFFILSGYDYICAYKQDIYVLFSPIKATEIVLYGQI